MPVPKLLGPKALPYGPVIRWDFERTFYAL